jgi:predicted TPR repeat methyltransferase
VCDGEADRAAYTLFREAELVEADGDSDRAAKMYRQCMRMSPPLAKALGL